MQRTTRTQDTDPDDDRLYRDEMLDGLRGLTAEGGETPAPDRTEYDIPTDTGGGLTGYPDMPTSPSYPSDAPSSMTPMGEYQPQTAGMSYRAPYGGWNNAGDETNYLRELQDAIDRAAAAAPATATGTGAGSPAPVAPGLEVGGWAEGHPEWLPGAPSVGAAAGASTAGASTATGFTPLATLPTIPGTNPPATALPPVTPATLSEQLRARLLALISQDPTAVSIDDPSLAPASLAFRRAQERSVARQREAAAERANAQGLGGGSGSLDAYTERAIQASGNAQASHDAGLVINELTQRRDQLVNMLKITAGVTSSEQDAQIRMQIANLNAELERLKVSTTASEGQLERDLRDAIAELQYGD